MSKIDALCISKVKGTPKGPVSQAEFRAGHGIVGDAHAGPGHRQVSLLAAEDIAVARKKLPCLKDGAFAENVITSGVELAGLGLGSRIRIGRGVELSVTQIGKVCHKPCKISQATGECIMPKLGLFARVESPGLVRPGDAVEILQAIPPATFQAVVLTISDRCAAGQAEDTAGPATAELLRAGLGAHIYRPEVLPDDRRKIVDRLTHYCDGHTIDIVATVGGTGFSPSDVTPEATAEVIERPTPGLDEAMRVESMKKTPRAMLSRAGSGIRGRTLIVNLPGSLRGAIENLQAILPALPHGLAKLRGDKSDCGL